MTPPKSTDDNLPDLPKSVLREQQVEYGFIWHSSGSGKTLSSFKAASLHKENDSIHKCVFVVERRDLDRQTREGFNRFQGGCVEENSNTAALVCRWLSAPCGDSFGRRALA